MRVQGFSARRIGDNSWRLARARNPRVFTFLAGLVFAIVAASLFFTQRGTPWLSLGILFFAAILFWGALVREEISICRDGIAYRKGVVFLRLREFPFSELNGIYYGPVSLLMRNRSVPAFRVWIEFSGSSLPKSVVYEKKLNKDTNEIQQKGEALAREIAGSLGLSAIYLAPSG